METTLKIISGKYYKLMKLKDISKDTIQLEFPYDPYIISEIKQLEGARWNPDKKVWTIRKCQHNAFNLEYLSGNNPYKKWEQPLINYVSKRALYSHQLNMVKCGLTYKQVIFAVEMGCGKTLAAIEILEYLKEKNIIWVGPKSALEAIQLEFLRWNSKVYPQMYTYDSLKKFVSNPFKVPRIVIFDEFSKVRNPHTQRAAAAQFITDKMREEYGDEHYIIGMSGTPAPQSPADWYSLAKIVCPGFLKEGSFEKFKRRLGLIVQKENMSQGVYPELLTWYDDEYKCKKCGKLEDDFIHITGEIIDEDTHIFEKSINEIKGLYERLKGLVVIHFKKDVLKDLPDKIYRIVQCTPNEETLRAAKLIINSAKNTVSANVLLRELSDGFQYKNVEVGMQICDACKGNYKIIHPVLIEWKCNNCELKGEDEFILCPKCETPINEDHKRYEQQEIDCLYCDGSGEVPREERQTIQVVSPKEQAFIDLLEENEDVGRVITYAGFTGSVDKCVDICVKKKWNVLRVDGRGWRADWGIESPVEYLKEFQRIGKRKFLDKVAFIGQADSAGMGVTLTSACMQIYYSNSFKAESRIQSEDRAHRPGMDINKGLTIVDIFNLPSDKKVFDIVQKKKRLQDISLGDFKELFV